MWPEVKGKEGFITACNGAFFIECLVMEAEVHTEISSLNKWLILHFSIILNCFRLC